MVIVISIFAAVCVFCTLLAALNRAYAEQITLEGRIGKLIRKTAKKADAEAGDAGTKPGRGRRFNAGDKIAGQLESAGIPLKGEEFLLAWAAAALLPAGLVLFFGGSAVTAVGLALAGAVIPPFIVSRSRKKRLALFEKQLGDALGIIGNCLRSGFTFQQAMESISTEMAEPISKEFGKTLREMRLGVPIETAMDDLVKRMNNPDLGMLVSAVLIQRQVGGNLAEIIDNVSATIKDRLKIKGDIKVMSASGRISGMVIGLLPVFLMGVLMVLNPTYVMTFFASTLGIALLVVAGVMELTGFLLVQKIVDIKF